MDYRRAFVMMVAHCQAIGDISTDENVYEELAFICDCDEEDIKEALD